MTEQPRHVYIEAYAKVQRKNSVNLACRNEQGNGPNGII
jgi:hypothetical protein